MKENYLIIPDVHGRDFWKKDVYHVVENDENTKIIFLGDYLDPYPYEWERNYELEYDAPDFRENALEVFKEIIDLKKRCPNQIILLLGNHDCGYIWDSVCSCRRDRVRYKEISDLFNSNLYLFDLAYQTQIGDKKYLFTHAGVHKIWLSNVFDDNIKYDNISDYLNNWLHLDNNELGKEYLLGMYSYFRGYIDHNYGSCIWSDVREWSSELGNVEENKKLGFYQIFGHTQLENEPIVRDSFACLDVRRVFYLSDENKLLDPYHPTCEWEYDLMNLKKK